MVSGPSLQLVHGLSDQFAGDSKVDATPYIRDVEPLATDHPAREEIAARLEAVEARTETRFVVLDGKLDRLADSIAALNGSIAELKTTAGSISTEAAKENKSTRTTILVTVIGAAIAIVGLVYAMQGGLLTAFQTGLNAQPFAQHVEPPVGKTP